MQQVNGLSRVSGTHRGESIISPASIDGPAGRGGDGGGRSAWWSASGGREDPCFVAVALHAALIDGRTYRVVSSDGAATNPGSGATTGWVLLSGAEQATFTDTFDAAFTDAVITEAYSGITHTSE
jgi:hypothetical protein